MKLNCDSIIIDGVLYEYTYEKNNIHIDMSCTISKKYFDSALVGIEEAHPELNVWKRSMKSLKRELATHNLLYSWGIAKSRTRDCDLNYPLKWYVSVAYWVIGSLALLIIK